MAIFSSTAKQPGDFNVAKRYVWVIDQVWGQDGWILAKFLFFCVFMDQDEVEVHKHASFLRDKACILSGQDSSILPARVANHSARFGSSCPLTGLSRHILNKFIDHS